MNQNEPLARSLERHAHRLNLDFISWFDTNLVAHLDCAKRKEIQDKHFSKYQRLMQRALLFHTGGEVDLRGTNRM